MHHKPKSIFCRKAPGVPPTYPDEEPVFWFYPTDISGHDGVILFQVSSVFQLIMLQPFPLLFHDVEKSLTGLFQRPPQRPYNMHRHRLPG